MPERRCSGAASADPVGRREQGVRPVLQKLLMWALDAEGGAEERRQERERRRDDRLDFNRAKLPISRRRTQATFQLKDMSRRGACGISDMPLAVGAVIFVRLAKGHYQAAEVRWVNNAQIGVRFFRPLQSEMFDRLRKTRLQDGRRTAASPGSLFTRR
jgi:hypothetical protein